MCNFHIQNLIIPVKIIQIACFFLTCRFWWCKIIKNKMLQAPEFWISSSISNISTIWNSKNPFFFKFGHFLTHREAISFLKIKNLAATRFFYWYVINLKTFHWKSYIFDTPPSKVKSEKYVYDFHKLGPPRCLKMYK